jgi:type IV pilus assembly protein PilQ
MNKIRLWAVVAAIVAGTTIAGMGATPQEQVPVAVAVVQDGAPTYSGMPIDVDYESANLRTVLRQLSEIGGLNLVIDPSVPTDGTVDLRLAQVPWDQVMDVVLKSGQLVSEREGSVVRVLTREMQTKEFSDQATQKRASQQAPDLEMLRVRLNYASASAVAQLLKDAQFLTTGRGSVQFEERTNMLIVRDTPQNIGEIRALVADIDKPEQQVEIEARIVQTNRDTARALGVQWGFNGRATPELGNTTNLGFPNSGTVGGRVQGSQGAMTQGAQGSDPRAGGLERVGTAVDLGVPGANTAVGMALGAINGAFNLDVALSALEKTGSLKIISTPRVTTQNNKQAEVTQGFEIPYQVVSNNTVTIQFKDAALKLVVKPQITAARTVIMEISLENGSPDASLGIDGSPAIRTDRASTQVQVPDGQTTVIGGIVQTRESTSNERTPGISRIPILGWLFRNSDTSQLTQELLIFITPRII